MDVKRFRYLFIILSILLLVYMIMLSRKAGINCDEVLHYDHSVAVYNYFASDGKDTSALHTPISHLKYYGQGYDNLATIIIRLFGIDDIYGFRHLMSTIAGWMAVMAAALLALWLSGCNSAVLVIILFAVSPTFLGHAQNNLKDIPFAAAYISGIYFTFRLLFSGKNNRLSDSVLLGLSIALCLSIRPGGLLLICLLWFFLTVYYLNRYIAEGKAVLNEVLRKTLLVIIITVCGFFLGISLWPYALQDPIRNVIESYRVMVNFPDTFREIFGGKYEWSDYMPWYYLPKSMVITIPLVITTGFILSFLLIRAAVEKEKRIFILFLLISIILPVVFVIIYDSNLYSGWRHFLFVYPGIVILSALAFSVIFTGNKKWSGKIVLILAFIAASLHPVYFIVTNKPYAYLYYNQLVGGVKGAFGRYETDYYYVNQRESSQWLVNYLERRNIRDSLVVASNFSAKWYFRNKTCIRNVYIRNEERSMHDWDYLITTNRYITPYKLENKLWPPGDALHVVYAGGVPISAVTERKTKADYYGWLAMEEGKNKEAAGLFEEALKINRSDEMIFYNFAVVLNRIGEKEKADSALIRCLEINPEFEPAIMYAGNLALSSGDKEKAAELYRRLIRINRKYFEAYEKLAELN